jgi:hypothetical protein
MSVRALRLVAAVVTAAALAACSSTSEGTGTGAGPRTGLSSAGAASSAPASSPSTPTSSTPVGTPTPSKTAATPSTSSRPTSSHPTSSHPPTGSGGGTYTGKGDPNTWCGSAQIAVTATHPEGGGAGGHDGVVLRFLNVSHHACILYGYPGVDGTRRGHSVASAKRTTDGFLGGCHCTQPRGVRVSPGETASALVEGDEGAGGPQCNRFTGLLVTPPNGYDSTPVNLAPPSCDFVVHPVVTGSNGIA